MTQVLIGLDVGGTQINAAAFCEDGSAQAEETAPTGDEGSRDWLDHTRSVARPLLQRVSGAVRVRVAAPGLPSKDRSRMAYMPGRLPGLEGLNWQEWLEVDRGVPVFNDAQAALLGEVWIGAARDAANVVLLTLGTGVGGAAMVDGRILRGHIGRAGHLGHVSLDPRGAPDITGTPGSLEDAIGECSLPTRGKGRFASTRELVEAFRAGSPEAMDVWLRSIRALAAALAGFVNVLDPEIVVLGGGIADANEALFDPLQAHLDEFEWRPGGARVRLAKAALGRNAGAAGAAYGAKLAAEGIL